MTFDLYPLPRILFGPGRIASLPEHARLFGQKPLLIYNGRALDSVRPLLSHPVLLHQHGEPTVADIDNALDRARSTNCDFIVALGGGSAIDAAKAAAALLTNPGHPADYMEVVGAGKKITQPAKPWIAIPTTAGTGAEVTRNAVIGSPEKKFKASIRSEHLLPRLVIIDPELQLDVPANVTARCGADALCQCIEAYVSKNANPITDALALEGITLAARSLKRAFDDGNDLAARTDMALAALLSGIALTNAGLGAVHGFAAPIGANFPIPHGVICGLLLPHVIRANINAANEPTRSKYAQIGRIFTSTHDLPEADALQACIDFTTTLIRKLDLPPLSTFGFTTDNVGEMVSLAKQASSMRYNPIPLSDEALTAILHFSLSPCLGFPH